MNQLFKKKNLRVKIIGRNINDLLPLLTKYPIQLVDENPDLVISHGGDGFLLGAERQFPGVPKCPIRDRKQNPKCPRHSEESTLEKLFTGQLKCQNIIHLTAQAPNNNSLTAINDLVLTRKLVTSANRYRIWTNGELFSPQIVADSLVFCTSFGSTGYFQSITRGILHSGIGIAFNNAMDGPEFLVVPEDTKIEIALLRGPAVLIADNNPASINIHEQEKIVIESTSLKTPIYGIDIFRCPYCYELRRTIDPAGSTSKEQ